MIIAAVAGQVIQWVTIYLIALLAFNLLMSKLPDPARVPYLLENTNPAR